MPKSYLSDEPACQRAERNYFDPYLQVTSRLRALTQMGHSTDKIELIVLGGTWSDYPIGYQLWFVTELFRALNDGEKRELHSKERRQLYRSKGISNRSETLAELAGALQQEISRGALSYNQGITRLYEDSEVWASIASEQIADLNELTRQQSTNETAACRIVGLVIETRPDTITCDSLKMLRRLGCTKVQVGIQSLSPTLLKLNERNISVEKIRESFELLRIFGFKIHAHFMSNLYGSSLEDDKADYQRFVTEKPYLPDEVKLYPCSLVDGTRLCRHYEDTSWQPYREEELIDLLAADMLATPVFTRISRMVRDISAHDILAGNKKANLRQLVESKLEAEGKGIAEIRYREVSTSEIDIEALVLETFSYETTVSKEFFLQWVTPQNRIAGFLRLSLPNADFLRKHQSALPVCPSEAMIREVHVYGKVARLHQAVDGAQHLGLGRQLVEAACNIAKARGYAKINVISSVGTREYYRGLGFEDNGLYQQMTLA
jgi:elongator complex protein 3